MYSSVSLAKKYLNYYIKSSNGKGHGMHSPFVFDFILNVLNNGKGYHPLESIEETRERLLNDNRTVEIRELGAGSRKKNQHVKMVSEIAGVALKSKKYAHVLYRLVKHYQPKTIVELGTSLGITSAYMACANPDAELFTIEGNAQVAVIAMDQIKSLGFKKVHFTVGNFDDVLEQVLLSSAKLDLGFIDGNHRFEPTMTYFKQMLRKIHNESVLVFDDIHWSPEMEKAWEEIKAHPAVKYTIDIFFLGFVFFRDDFKVKQDFTIRF